MEMLEKVDRLRERANVTYEEARAALEEAGGDLLDAMVILERMGKAKEPGQGTFSTEYEDQESYIRVRDKVEEQEKSAPSFKRVLRDAFHFIKNTLFIVTRNEKTMFTMPSAVFVLLLLFFWEAIVPVMIIALFFGVRYTFEGTESAEKANKILGKAGDFAEDIRNEFTSKEGAFGEDARNACDEGDRDE